MRRTNIYLDETQLRALRHLAAEEERPVAEVVRQAVDEYLARRMPDADEWQRRFEVLLARVRQRVPAGVTPQEIEDDISVARAEAGAQRTAHASHRR